MSTHGYVFAGLLLLASVAPAEVAEEARYIALLKSAAPLAQKAAACRQLAAIGTKRAVPTLAGLLGDERLGDYARMALEPIADPSVDEVLRGATGRLRGRALAGVVNSLGVRRDARAVGTLTKLLRDRSSGVSAEALAALGRIATREAVAAIRQVLADGPAALRAEAADACLAAAEQRRAKNQPKEAAALYDAVGKADVPAHLAAAAAYHGIVVRGTAGAAALVAGLQDGRPALRAAALRAARAMPARDVTKALVDQLGKSAAGLQVLLVQVLVEREADDVRGPIAALAGSKSPAVRSEAIKALGRAGDASSVPVLLKAAGGSGAEAAGAMTSLRELEGKGVGEAILAGMTRAKSPARAELIRVLADRQYGPAVRALPAEAASTDAEVSAAAFKALGALAGPKELPAMVDLLLGTKGSPGRTAAENAVVVVAGRIADPARRADSVLAALAKAKTPADRALLLRAAGRIGGAKAYQAVAGAVDDRDAAVRDAAVRALAAWPDARAEGALWHLAKDAASEVHRVLALRGYVRLLGLAPAGDRRETVRKYAEALALADRPDARKLVLAGLAGAAHADALELAAKHLADPAVRAEAAHAVMTLARATLGTDREAARGTLEKLLAVVKDKRVAAQARQIIGQIDQFADSITAWRVAGPYEQKGKDYRQLFDIAFEPEKPGAKGVTWRVLPAGTDPQRPRILDLKKAIGGDQRAAYALTWVHSEQSQPARLELGSDDGVKAWLNGRLVHANNTARAAVAYTDKADITLKAGWNPLLLKITQNQIPWEFCARICRRDGGTLTTIRIDPSHSGDWTLSDAAGKGK